MSNLDWQDGAACIGADADLFFPPRGPKQHPFNTAARDICRTCPVQVECLEYALVENIQHGVWGGTSERERRRIRRERRLRVAS
jgi:WhiB family redox-sensing transcriptional regulator